MSNYKIQCCACRTELSANDKECPGCAWFVRLLETHHPAAKHITNYLYNMAFNDGYSDISQKRFLKEIELLENNFEADTPCANVWREWRSAWFKFGYAMRFVIEYKGTGTIKFYHPGGIVNYQAQYHNGKYIA